MPFTMQDGKFLAARTGRNFTRPFVRIFHFRDGPKDDPGYSLPKENSEKKKCATEDSGENYQ